MLQLSAFFTDGETAAANQKSYHEDEAAGIHRKAEVFHLSAAAAKKQYDEKYPRAIASAEAAAVFAAAGFVVKQSVKHFLPPFRRDSGLSIFSDFFKSCFTIWFLFEMCYIVKARCFRHSFYRFGFVFPPTKSVVNIPKVKRLLATIDLVFAVSQIAFSGRNKNGRNAVSFGRVSVRIP